MKVDSISKVKLNSVKSPKKKSVSKGGFGSMIEEESVSTAQGVSSINIIDSLLDLQEIQTSGITQKEVERGYDILDHLKKLQLSIVCGEVSEQSLELLTEMVKSSRDKLTDPALNYILNEIELRAEIELVKILQRKK